MKQILALVYFSLFTNTVLASSAPITVSCTDPNTPDISLTLEANLLANTATVYYKGHDDASSVFVSIHEAHGIYSHASVNVSSFAHGRLWGTKEIKISGSFAEPLRVTRYANFSLTLSENDNGTYVAKELVYEQGIDAFPDSQEKGTVDLKNMTCTISGL